MFFLFIFRSLSIYPMPDIYSNDVSNDTKCGYDTEICSGYCYKGSFCISSSFDEFVCTKVYYTIPIGISIALFPTILAAIIGLCCKNYSSMYTLILNMISNIFLGVLIGALSCKYTEIPEIGISIFASVISMLIYYCFVRINICGGGLECYNSSLYNKDGPDKNMCCGIKRRSLDTLKVIKELSSPIVPYNELTTVMDENLMIPPTPHIHAVSYVRIPPRSHVFNDEEYDQEIQYETWQEDNIGVYVRQKRKIAIYNCNIYYEYEDNMNPNIKEAKKKALTLFKKKYLYAETFTENRTSGSINEFMCIKGDSSIFVKIFKNWFIKSLLYNFLMILGYSGIFDLIWHSQVEILNLTSRKLISSSNDLRAKQGERDHGANEFVQDQNPMNQNLL